MTNDYNINQHTAKKHEVTMYYQRNNEGKADLKLKKIQLSSYLLEQPQNLAFHALGILG